MKHSQNLLLVVAFQKFIAASSSGRRCKPDGNKISSGTIGNYKNTLRLINLFSRKTGFLCELHSAVKMSSTAFHSRKQYWSRFYRQFREFLYLQGHLDNYISHTFKTIRAVLRWFHQEKGWMDHQFLPHQWLQTRLNNFHVINPEQFRILLFDQALQARLTHRMQLVRHLMIIGCTTALRASDLLHLQKRQILVQGAQTWLTLNSQKTKQQSSLLLPEYVTSIFDKYKIRGKNLLPAISNGNFNKGIKKICELAGWTYPVIKIRDKKGSPVPQYNHKCGDRQYRFCDIITTHSLRRSAITILLMMGMPEHLVRQISGHKPGSKEFYRYVHLSQQWQDEESKKAFERITKPE